MVKRTLRIGCRNCRTETERVVWVGATTDPIQPDELLCTSVGHHQAAGPGSPITNTVLLSVVEVDADPTAEYVTGQCAILEGRTPRLPDPATQIEQERQRAAEREAEQQRVQGTPEAQESARAVSGYLRRAYGHVFREAAGQLYEPTPQRASESEHERRLSSGGCPPSPRASTRASRASRWRSPRRPATTLS
jgi:hypothetical protein